MPAGPGEMSGQALLFLSIVRPGGRHSPFRTQKDDMKTRLFFPEDIVWRTQYNPARPHSALGFVRPEPFRLAG